MRPLACVEPYGEANLGPCGVWFDFFELESRPAEVAGVGSRRGSNVHGSQADVAADSKQLFLFRIMRHRVHCLLLYGRERAGFLVSTFKFQLEVRNAEPGSTLRMKVDVLGENW